MAKYETLKHLREALGYRLDAVVRLTSLSQARVHAIEDGNAPTVFELDELSRLYGIDADVLAEQPIKVSTSDAIDVLASLDEFHEIGDVVRARVTAAANAARDLVTLRQLANESYSLEKFRASIPKLKFRSHAQPWEQGDEIALALRSHLKIKGAPIPSMRDFVTEFFPPVHVLYADLTREGPAGLSFVDTIRGPTIVLNLDGKNTNPCVRRFSLAHELCHLLIDWNGRKPLAQLSGYLTESGLDRERRANAFAVRLLCPRAIVDRISTANPLPQVAAINSKYGLHYSAIRLALMYRKNVTIPPIPPAGLLAHDLAWDLAEQPTGIGTFPFEATPPERRTLVAETAARLYAMGKLPRDAFARVLGLTPADEVERVLDQFGVPTPADAA